MSLRNAITGKDGRIAFVRTDFIEQFGTVLRRDLKAQIGLGIVLAVSVAAVLAPELAPYDPMAQGFIPLMAPDPLGQNILGTDSFGRDLLSRLMWGARISVSVALLAVSAATMAGVTIGLVSGYFGGWVDDILMRMIDIIWAFPWLLIAILTVALFGQGYWNVVAALGIAYLDDFARITRGEVLSIREEEYILAADSIGLNDLNIMFEEVLPNAIAPILVQFSVLVARAMVAEATLSFLGLGVKPTTPTWGAILRGGRDLMISSWWISVLPGVLIVVTAFGINLTGDALRDSFNVKEIQESE